MRAKFQPRKNSRGRSRIARARTAASRHDPIGTRARNRLRRARTGAGGLKGGGDRGGRPDISGVRISGPKRIRVRRSAAIGRSRAAAAKSRNRQKNEQIGRTPARADRWPGRKPGACVFPPLFPLRVGRGAAWLFDGRAEHIGKHETSAYIHAAARAPAPLAGSRHFARARSEILFSFPFPVFFCATP